MKIFACHLLNDYSGSPKVLSQLINGWVNANNQVVVVTGRNQKGFLSDISGAEYLYFPYELKANPFLRLFCLVYAQICMMIKLWPMVRKNDIVYVNTVLPFGAAILGRIKGCRVIYHVHETSIKPKMLKWFLFSVARITASKAVYVSAFLKNQEPILEGRSHVLYNALETKFITEAKKTENQKQHDKNVLMLCSLKRYKGISEFMMLAEHNPDYRFILVVNASEQEIEKFSKKNKIPENTTLFPVQSNTHPFYRWADVVLNLSRPDMWIETFGLTIIEAMAYSLPVIVPPTGGITELVEDGVNGFCVDSRNIDQLSDKLRFILENKEVYGRMQSASRARGLQFTERAFIEKNIQFLKELR